MRMKMRSGTVQYSLCNAISRNREELERHLAIRRKKLATLSFDRQKRVLDRQAMDRAEVCGGAMRVLSNKQANVTPSSCSVNQSGADYSDTDFPGDKNPVNLFGGIGGVERDGPVLSKGFCDRLVITFPVSEDIKLHVRNFFKKENRKNSEPYFVVMRRTDSKDLYLKRYEIRLPVEGGEFLLLFECEPRYATMRYARIEFSGRAFQATYSSAVKSFVSSVLGSDYRNVIAGASITRFDAAVDIYDSPRSLLYATNRARDMTTWIRHGGAHGEIWEIETLCYGSSNSDYRVIIYDKGVERWNTVFDNSMSGTKRVEVRFSEKEEGRCLTTYDFKRLSNPFLPISIGRYPVCSGEEDCNFFFFLTSVERFGSDGMLQLIKDRRRRSQYRKRLSSDPHSWWRPEIIWQQVLSQLREIDFFLDDSFGDF